MYRKNIVTDWVDENPIGIIGNASRIEKFPFIIAKFLGMHSTSVSGFSGTNPSQILLRYFQKNHWIIFLLPIIKFWKLLIGCCSDRQNVWWKRLNNYYYKLTSLFHQDGKGSVSWSLNITNVNIMINISVVIRRTSSHETSHEIDEFRVHSNYYLCSFKLGSGLGSSF